MSRNIHRGNRCARCKMKLEVCLCELLLPIETKTFVTVLMHYRERISTTNTARIAHEILPMSEIFYRGLIDQSLSAEKVFKKDYTPIYLYPSENAQQLTKEVLKQFDKPIQLIVPDGSWRQTKKFPRREKFLSMIPHFQLSLDKPSLFFVRRKVKNEGMSTMEAIARALGILESTDIQEKMEKVFYTMMERTLITRGKKIEDKTEYLYGWNKS